MPPAFDFIVRKDSIVTCDIIPATPLEDLNPRAGEIVVKIDRFALTANNITYAAMGERFSYWDFFPTEEKGWGRVPVWGFADVIKSNCEGVAEGERFYGYYPISSYLKMTPIKMTDHGFSDGSKHRLKLHPVYNAYSRCAADPIYHKKFEDYEMLLRPLFMTSFLIDDYFADNGFFGASTIILSSASSKTALGTAFLLNRNRQDQCKIIGLTSPGNKAFVEGLGLYNDVVLYDEVAQMDNQTSAAYIDFAGNKGLRRALHERFADRLKFDSIVGGSHLNDLGMDKDLPGAKPLLFFAPNQAKKRSQEWGSQGLNQRMVAAWKTFLKPLTEWINVTQGEGPEAIKAGYLEMLAGKVTPDRGVVLVP